MSGWALEAIEREAMSRAMRNFDYENLKVLGLNIQQIRHLRHEWMLQHPGKDLSEIPGGQA